MTPEVRATVWISKWALTSGLVQMEVFLVEGGHYAYNVEGADRGFFAKPHWHMTKEEAVARAEAMRKSKIASMKKRIAKLALMKFS